MKDTLDFSKPGSEGTLPAQYTPWRWAVAYTVRPELLSALTHGKEYRIIVSILRNRPDGRTFKGYADLYERAHTIADARVAELASGPSCQALHTRILGHTWLRHGSTNLVRAVVTLGVTCLKEGEVGPKGENKPIVDALAVPGGVTAEQLSGANKGFDEVYSDGDIRDDSATKGIFLFSYGQYVEAADKVDYAPLVRRADQLTRFHVRFLESKPTLSGRLNIIKREWFCATNPDIAVVHVFVEL
jgi:hypothetical protein